MARGGKRPGAGRKTASHTLEASKFREELIRRVIEEQGPIIDALIFRAKEGDVRALSEVLDRVLGKVTQPMDVTSDGKPLPQPIYAGISIQRYDGDQKNLLAPKED